MVEILTQKNQKGVELPISFMNRDSCDYELRYSPLEKKAFALVKVVGYFRSYILSTLVEAFLILWLR